MTRSIADPLVLDGFFQEWKPPAVLPPLQDARLAVKALEQMTAPADLDHVKGCLKFIAYATAHKDATQDDWKYRTRVYAFALKDIPPDIWTATAKEIVTTSEWWPPVAKLSKIMQPKIDQRRRQLERARKIIEAHGIRPAAPKAAVPVETTRKRVLNTCVIFRKHGMTDRLQLAQKELVKMRYGTPKPTPRPKVDLMAKVGAELKREMTPAEIERAEALRAETLRQLKGEDAQ